MNSKITGGLCSGLELGLRVGLRFGSSAAMASEIATGTFGKEKSQFAARSILSKLDMYTSGRIQTRPWQICSTGSYRRACVLVDSFP